MFFFLCPCENIYLFNFFLSQRIDTDLYLSLLVKSVFKWFACMYKNGKKVNKGHFDLLQFVFSPKQHHHFYACFRFVRIILDIFKSFHFIA